MGPSLVPLLVMVPGALLVAWMIHRESKRRDAASDAVLRDIKERCRVTVRYDSSGNPCEIVDARGTRYVVCGGGGGGGSETARGTTLFTGTGGGGGDVLEATIQTFTGAGTWTKPGDLDKRCA